MDFICQVLDVQSEEVQQHGLYEIAEMPQVGGSVLTL